MFKYIIDKETELRPLDIQKAEALYNLADKNRQYLKAWLPWLDGSKSVEDTRAYIEMSLRQYAANKGFGATIWYQGQLAGIIDYHTINWENKSTSIGYWLGADFQGKGLMTRATEVFVNYAIEEIGLNRVEIRCAEGNVKSRAIPERLGFTKEGIIREAEWLYDHYVDHVVYGILAKDWKKIKV